MSTNNILLTGRGVRRATQVMPKKWWPSISYDYVLAAIQAKFHEVIAHVLFV
jgi:hypothetical protein